MPRFTDAFLDDLRRRVPVSEVVGRVIKIKRQGAEFKGLSPFSDEKSPSFTVNDAKQFWHDFSAGKHGDVFSFLTLTKGIDFVAAVEEVARMAGVPIPDDRRPVLYGARNGAGNGHASPGREPEPPPVDGPEAYGAEPLPASGSGARQITKTYPYIDADGGLLYEVVRQEWVERGKRKKSFLQRRVLGTENEKPVYAWGLKDGVYVRARNGEFYQITDDRQSWPGERRELDVVAHSLYRLPELIEERNAGDEARTVLLCEGEKDTDTAVEKLDFVATTNSGGARTWETYLADQFYDLDVVVVADNDKAGREGAHKKAASLRGVAKRVRVLDWRDHWKDAPEKADLTDWVEQAGGTREQLFRIIDRLPEWNPPRPESSFGAFTWGEIDSPGLQLEWLVKGLLVRRGTSVWYGAPGCGKSFLVNDCALSIARGVSWFGRRVRRGLVIYAAPEGGSGFKTRLRAYRLANKVSADEPIPIVTLPSDINLYRSEDDAKKLVEEVMAWSRFYDQMVELVVVDTLAAATVGWDENSGKDVGPVLARCAWVSRTTGTHVALIHHSNAVGGKPRGHTSLTGNVDNVIEVVQTEQQDVAERDDGSKQIRMIKQFIARKVKEGESGWAEPFVLKQVKLGTDLDGDPITSCVVVPPVAGNRAAEITRGEVPPGFAIIKNNDLMFMRGLKMALEKHGVIGPEGVSCGSATRAVRVMDWREVMLKELYVGGDAREKKKLQDRVRNAVTRICSDGRWTEKARLMGRDGDWVWRTGRNVFGVDEYTPPPARPNRERPALAATGETAEQAGRVDDDMPF